MSLSNSSCQSVKFVLPVSPGVMMRLQVSTQKDVPLLEEFLASLGWEHTGTKAIKRNSGMLHKC